MIINPHLTAGAAIAAVTAACLAWAVFVHGPAQRRAGAAEALINADAATRDAANAIADQADRGRFLRNQCRATGGVYIIADGQCQR